MVTERPATFELRSETLCRQLITERGRVVAAELSDLRDGTVQIVRPRAVVTACDALRTPQLLWASGIRPTALGHYLNDHILFMSTARLDRRFVEAARAALSPGQRTAGVSLDERLGGYWVPCSESHPCHGQIMPHELSPIRGSATDDGLGPTIAVNHAAAKDIRFEDCVTFSETEVDLYGMPKIQIRYGFTEQDMKAIETAKRLQARTVAALGGFAGGDDITVSFRLGRHCITRDRSGWKARMTERQSVIRARGSGAWKTSSWVETV